MMEESDQGDGIGRERLFVCQLVLCQVNFFNLPPAWMATESNGRENSRSTGQGEWDYM